MQNASKPAAVATPPERDVARAAKRSPIKAIRGMKEVLPDESPLWERFEDTARRIFAQYGYRNLRVPIVEATALFERGIGNATDLSLIHI